MKNLLLGGLLVGAVCAAETDRLQDLPPETFRAAGLHKLDAAELQALEALWAQRTIAAAPAGNRPGWLEALVTLRRVEEKPDEAVALESRLAGDFTGWTGRTRFRLENGQVWQQVGGGEYGGIRLHQPAVRIYPAALGGYWLQVEGLRQRVRVQPHQLE